MPTTIHSHPAVVLDRVTFTWPDGTPALHEVSGAFGAGRTGLGGLFGAVFGGRGRLRGAARGVREGRVVRGRVRGAIAGFHRGSS